ncbi:flavodoxin [Desnuesiella massiliensis]|uniref:flavodoxin n=1 Tax=Desnuesiella massiliensis TaxID=1650662 RepID=UPI0006E3DC01|nr:flavodoxin [Desnuesiella massiliensis]
MKKVSIVYWSSGGNVEVLADKISQGAKDAGAEVIIKTVSEAKVEDVVSSDAIAFGSPSMDNNRIEQQEMEPFINQFKLLPNNQKSLVLFGSYGWDEGKFMEGWKERMKDYNFNVIGDLTVKEAPSAEELNRAYELGRLLAK